MTKVLLVDLNALRSVVAEGGPARRLMGIAGAPGSGKSTLTGDLVAQLNAARPGIATVLDQQ